jgi:2-polyprenyl-6-methoxyphenol hydroxylase-like FAD-dependent oxidoreductase
MERALAQPITGTGLGMWPSALRALDQLGLGELARETGRPQASGAIRRPDGSVIAPLDMDKVRRKHGEGVYLLSRPALLGLLSAALPDGVVRYGSTVDDPLSLRGTYDLVVGADGINSKVRRSIFGTRHDLRYAGMTTWRGVAALDTSAGSETWGMGTKFGLTPEEPGRTNWYAVLSAPEGYQPSLDDAAELRRLFGTWHDPIPAIIDRYAESHPIRHDLHYLGPPLPSYVDRNVALLGDAAHAMTPDLGQGACQALIDGVALADCLAGADVAAGLRSYDNLRRQPTQRIAAMALRASRLSQLKRFTGLRNAAVRVALAIGTPA